MHDPPRITGFFLGIAVLVQTLLIAPHAFAADPSDFDKLKAGLLKIQNETKKATYSQMTWEKKGKDEAWYRSNCYWMGQSTIRMDIVGGKGEGGVAVLKNGKVTAFLSGILSFAKLTYDPMDSTVTGLRGHGMPSSGFMDDLKVILQNWDNRKVTFADDKAVIDYVGPDKFPAKMSVKSDGSLIIKTETYENGAVVNRNEYSRVNLAATFDPKQIFNP
jgi:hypothetical protein